MALLIDPDGTEFTTKTALAYWAGFLDQKSKGAVSMHGSHGIPRLRLRSQDEAYLRMAVRDLGGTLYVERREGKRPVWVYQRVGTPAKFLLNGMAPYLKRHRESLALVLRWRAKGRGPGPGRGHKGPRSVR